MGGEYSYFSALISAIDQFEFDKSLDITFVNFVKDNNLIFNRKNIDLAKRKQHENLIKVNVLKVCFKALSLLNMTSNSLFRKIGFKLQNISNIQIEAILKENKVDILYFITPSEVDLNYPYIATCWDLGHKSTYAFPELTMNGSWERRSKFNQDVYSKAFSIFCDSEAGKQDMVFYEKINPARIFALPMFAGGVVNIDLDISEQEDVLAFYELVKGHFFFYPAQFWSHKNHINLLYAFNEYLKENVNCKLVFTGSDKGNQGYVLQVVKELQLEGNVKFLGFVDNRTLYSLYKNAIALVFPSFLGPTNMPLLEAYELYCKVICSDLKGHREQLQEYALYFDPLDKNDILKKMRDVNFYNPIKVDDNRTSITKCCSTLNDHFLDIKKFRNSFGLNFNQF